MIRWIESGVKVEIVVGENVRVGCDRVDVVVGDWKGVGWGVVVRRCISRCWG